MPSVRANVKVAPSSDDAANNLLAKAIVCDMTVPWSDMPGDTAKQDALLPRMRALGMTYVSLTLATDSQSTEAMWSNIAAARAMILGKPDQFLLVETASDIERAKREGLLGVGLHFQGTLPIGPHLELVEPLYRLGIRHLVLAYNERNLVADGCHERTDAGLSNFGLRLIAEMNRVGMLVDVAHTGYKSSMEAIEASTEPVIVSHGNIKAINDHPRCYRDDQIQALARTGGVIGLTGLGIFLGNNEATVERYVRSIRHVVDLVGHRHVGIGSDYVFDMEALTAYARSFADRWPASGGYTLAKVNQIEPEMWLQVVDELLRCGLSDEQVLDILGGNWLRVMKAVWK